MNHLKDADAATTDVVGKQAQATYHRSQLVDRLLGDAKNLGDQQQRTQRALTILTRHPEFEELIELLGLIRVDIRMAPIFAEKALVLE